MWPRDNRAIQHHGVDGSDGHERRLRRVTMDGDVPAGVDGVPSRLLEPPAAVPAPSFGAPPAPPPRSPEPVVAMTGCGGIR